jgi:hypothetical protein
VTYRSIHKGRKKGSLMKRRELVVRKEQLHGDMHLQATTYLPGHGGQFSEGPEAAPSRVQKFHHSEFPGWPDTVD